MTAVALVPPVQSPPMAIARSRALDADDLSDCVARAKQLALQLRAFAAQLDFGDLNLPDAIGSEEDQARVRSAATLYFASELESAGLLPALETFAALWVSGALPVDLGPIGDRLVSYYRSRDQRLTAEEREAMFGRLFGKSYGPEYATGPGRNVGFESSMIGFASALSDLDTNAYRTYPRPADVARLRAAASTLAGSLAQRALGVSGFIAEELLGNIRVALDVFKQRSAQAALGAFTLWDAVRSIVRRYAHEEVDVQPHLTRARSGLVLLAWLADQMPGLTGDMASFEPPDDEIVTHAVQWMQATLELHEQGALGAGSGAGV